MILSTLLSHDLPTAPLAAEPASEPADQTDSQGPNHLNTRVQIDRVIRQLDSPAVRGIIEPVFNDLLRLLECLSLVEGHLRHVDVAEESLAFFQIIHDEARVLVEFIREDGLNCAEMDEELRDTLDGIAFAVSHDLQRVFDTGTHSATAEKTTHIILSRLYRAHDLLTNCLQQSTITLAMMFDAELEGTKLFNNSDMRYRQSLQLCDGLSALLRLVETSVKIPADSLDALCAGLERFRNESLECLMYSDWPQFESFCERVKVAGDSSYDLESVLHQFRCYLETLLGQVRMRAVLANVSPMRFVSVEGSASLGPPDQSSNAFPSDTQEPQRRWDDFAVAV